MNRPEIIAKLNANAAGLKARGVRHISLFGSQARGTNSDVSDIDLAVELDPAAGLSGYEIVGIERELEAILGARVDIVVMPPRRQSLGEEIEKDGILAF